MTANHISRRDFLKVAGVTLGASSLACCGLSYVASQFPEVPETETPSYSYGKDTHMNQRILVTYATSTGSTVGVAEAIGKTLAENGALVDVLPMKAVTDLTPYHAVVAGSAIQAAQWLPEAVQFVQTHQAELRRKPFAAFLVCMTLAMKKGDYRQQVAAWLDPVCNMVKPVSKGLFAGALDIGKIKSFGDRIKFRLSVMMGVWSEGDHRDWNAIQNWAESLRPLLLS
jgi:menaquinone-dependent protoporphyrinogen oxidase